MRRWAVLAVAGVVSLLAPGAAQALTLVSAQVDSGRGCTDQACANQTLTWSSSSGAATGTFDIVGGSLNFSITLPSATFVPISGSDDNGVTQLVFSSTTYSSNGSVTLNDLGFGFYDFSGSASISGTQTPSGAGTAGPFSATDVNFGGSCLDDGSSFSCAIIFGAANDFNFDLNGQTRHFTHTMDLVAVPEPATAALFGAGLVGLGIAGGRRNRARRDPQA